jgi:exonuclease III
MAKNSTTTTGGRRNPTADKVLTVLLVNVNSLRHRINAVHHHLIANKVDVCAVQETKLGTHVPSPAIKGYSIIRRDRTQNGGGVAL